MKDSRAMIWKKIWEVRNEIEAVSVPAPGKPGRNEQMELVGTLQRKEKKLVRQARRLENAQLRAAGLLPEKQSVNLEMSRMLSRFF